MNKQNKYQVSIKQIEIFFFLFFVTVAILSMGVPFFWDGISRSVRASWYYEQNFNSILLPNALNSGHPSLFSFLLAVSWKVFGKSLWVSHLLVVPFVIGVAYQIILLGRRFLDEKSRVLFYCIVALSPTLLTQSLMIHPEIIMLFCFLVAFNNLQGNRIWMTMALVGLALLNIRGIILIGILFLFNIQERRKGESPHTVIQMLLPYFIVTLVIIKWMVYHYIKLGWVLFTPSESWSEHRQVANVLHMIKTLVVVIKAHVDNGRIVITGVGIWLIWKYRKMFVFKQVKPLIRSGITFTICYLLVLVPFTSPISNRYFMFNYLLMAAIFSYLVAQFPFKKMMSIFSVSLVVLVSGNFWIYPDRIAKSWDSMLGVMPYFELRENMLDYIEEKQLNYKEVGSEFPFVGKSVTDLVPSESFFEEYDLHEFNYIVLTNISNEFKDEDWAKIKTNWTLEKSFRSMGVYVDLYRKK